MNKKLESVILILVPDADIIVGKWREKHDRVARLGISAHITLLYPFKTPSTIDRVVINKLK